MDWEEMTPDEVETWLNFETVTAVIEEGNLIITRASDDGQLRVESANDAVLLFSKAKAEPPSSGFHTISPADPPEGEL